MKRKILAIALVVICLSTLGYGTLAYFTAEDTARNVITSGKLDIAIEEWQQTADGLVHYPKDEPIVVLPTAVVSKIVTVKNNEAESFIRAKLEVTLKNAAGEVKEMTPEEMERIIRLSLNSEDWLRKSGDDIWWYYDSAVDTGEATAPLLTQVEFDGPNMTNEYQNCTLEIDVIAQAVQTANNEPTVLEALGWPEGKEGGEE